MTVLPPVPGIAFRLLDGQQAAASEDDLLALCAEVALCAEACPVDARRLRVWRRQPGFALAEARHGGYLVGCVAGLPLRPATSWWKDLTTPLPDSVTTEHPGRTFALTALVVRAAWRRQGIATGLHALILAGRTEERATLAIPPGAIAAQRALRTWGWTKAARARADGDQVLDVLVLSPIERAAARPLCMYMKLIPGKEAHRGIYEVLHNHGVSLTVRAGLGMRVHVYRDVMYQPGYFNRQG